MTNCANVAATIHANMCNDPGFGYSQDERYGTSSDKVTYNIEGRNYTINRGDYDCSSSVCTAWQKALEGTQYEGRLDNASYTGNMYDVFVKSGLFDVWKTNSSSASRGDIYLEPGSHTAMCQNPSNPDTMSEFSINEFGGVSGGSRGDQTGRESAVNPFRNFSTYTLHYNGKADTNNVNAASWPLQMWNSNGTAAQKFRPVHNKDGSVTLVCVANNKCIDVNAAKVANGTEIWLYKSNGSTAQKWNLIQKTGTYNPGKVAPYEIVSALNKNYCLDVQGGAATPGTKVQLYKRNNSKAQEWYILDNGDGSWTLINNALGTKLVLDALNGGK